MPGVGSPRERQADRALVAAYEARLGELVEHVAEAVGRFRAAAQYAFAVDEVIHQYHRAARELWKFCWAAPAPAWSAPLASCATSPPPTNAPTAGSSALHANARLNDRSGGPLLTSPAAQFDAKRLRRR
jgi:hypothetical protein